MFSFSNTDSGLSPAIDPRKREIYMCVPAVRGPTEKSFEEERTEDYIKSYAATSQPPQPPPQFPKEDSARLALGLPPLFQPHVEVIAATTTSSSGSTLSSATVRPFFNGSASSGAAGSCAHIKEPANLPAIQLFNYATFDDDKSRFTSIGTLYTSFSQEEMRYYAYLNGNKYPPPGTVANTLPLTIESGSNEQMQSIVCKPEFSKHSFEELRIAYLMAGRELSSDEVLGSSTQNKPGFGTPAPVSNVAFGNTPAAAFGSLGGGTPLASSGVAFGSSGGTGTFGSSTSGGTFGSGAAGGSFTPVGGTSVFGSGGGGGGGGFGPSTGGNFGPGTGGTFGPGTSGNTFGSTTGGSAFSQSALRPW